MIEAYKKLVEYEAILSSNMSQNSEKIAEVRKILYQKKDFIIEYLIKYLKNEMDIEYFGYKTIDLNGNVADLIVKKDSLIFKKYIEEKDFLEFNIEELIDSRLFDNKDEIIIVDLNFEENILDFDYLCTSLDYNFLSYSDKLREKLEIFINYIITNKIYKK